MRFISIHSVLNILSECIYFYISKNITSYTFLLVYKVVKNRQCILKVISFKHRQLTKIKNRIRLRFLNIYILLAGALRQGHWSSCYYFCKKWSNYNIKYFCLKHKLMKYLSLKKKCRMKNQIYLSQLCRSLFSYKLLFEVKEIDVKPIKTLKSTFTLFSVYPSIPSNTVAKYTIYHPYEIGEKIIQVVFGLILLLYPMTDKNSLKKALHFTFWDRTFALGCLWKSSFFIAYFRHQDLSSYYLVVSTAKIPKIWKRTSLDVYFSIRKSEDHAISCQRFIQLKLINSLSNII